MKNLIEKIAGQELDLFCNGLGISPEELSQMPEDRIIKLFTLHERENTEWYGAESSGAEWAASALRYIAGMDETEVTTVENEPMSAPPAEIILSVPDATPIEFDTVETPEAEDTEETPGETYDGYAENVVSTKHLDGIIGQAITKERLTSFVQNAATGQPLLNPLVIGQAGQGKTAIIRAALKDVQANTNEWTVLEYGDPEEFRLAGDKFGELTRAILGEYGKVIIYVDEAHGLTYKPTVQLDKFRKFAMKYMDGNNEGQHIQFGEDSVRVDTSRLVIILSTNCPARLDRTGAFQSRCQVMKLDTYSKAELVDILQIMLKSKGFRAADTNTLGIMADCGRGTARELEHMIKEMRQFVKKDTVNKDDVKTALRLRSLFPDGLTADEVRILQRIVTPHKTPVLEQMFPNIEEKALKHSLSYFMALGYAVPVAGGNQRTALGTRYLDACKKQGFSMPD